MVQLTNALPWELGVKYGRIRTKDNLQNAPYIYKSRWYFNRVRSVTNEDDPYNQDLLIADYINHNKMVNEYSFLRPDDHLVLNVAYKNAYGKLTDFLGIDTEKNEFPWINKSQPHL